MCVCVYIYIYIFAYLQSRANIKYVFCMTTEYSFQFTSLLVQYHIGGDRSVMVTEVDTVIRVQILDETLSISHSANSIRKSMNPTVLPPEMGK